MGESVGGVGSLGFKWRREQVEREGEGEGFRVLGMGESGKGVRERHHGGR